MTVLGCTKRETPKTVIVGRLKAEPSARLRSRCGSIIPPLPDLVLP